ncbi:hypothetical protein [Armatimonas sp.]|uniref:hypothetical protein n=1 Tax=Armatimonas sp. TaxID=1872638 RepID=UPI00286B99C3|nr:hypothetical protein [Armatimonas sp.]
MAFFQKNPILEYGGWPVFPGSSHYQFLKDFSAIKPGMPLQQVQQRLSRYEIVRTNPYQESFFGWQTSNNPALKAARNGPRTHKGFTGDLSYNHNDSDRVSGSYVLNIVDDYVVQVSIYDE